METQGHEQAARTTIPALPLSIEQRNALLQAFDISIAAKRTGLNDLLRSYESWLRDNSPRHREVEDMAEAYAAEAMTLVRGIRSLQAMKETARKNNIVVKADA